MSRPRKKYQLYADPSQMKSSFVPIPAGWPPSLSTHHDENQPKKILAAIMAAVEKWLKESPSYRSSKNGSIIRISDASSRKRLAIIHFNEDHLIINTKSRFVPVASMPMVYYSDPELHTKVKFHVSQGYEQYPEL